MCGIFFALLRSYDGILADSDIQERLQQIIREVQESKLRRRGPDAFDSKTIQLITGIHSVWCGCTLHFRGNITRQPLECPNGNLLLWNGEIFGGLQVEPTENDGFVLLDKLSSCDSMCDLQLVVQQLQGPYSLIFWQNQRDILWLCQDFFGRRSLLVSVNPKSRHLKITSVAIPGETNWKELPVKGLYRLQFSAGNISQDSVTIYPWSWQTTTTTTNSQPHGCSSMLHSHSVDVELISDIFPGFSVSVGEAICPPFAPFRAMLPEDQNIVQLPKSIPLAASGQIDCSELLDHPLIHIANELSEILLQAVKTRVQCQSNLCSECIQKYIGQHSDLECASRVNTVDIDDPYHASYNKQPISIRGEATNCHIVNTDEANIQDSCLDIEKSGFISFPTEPCGHARVAILYSGGIDSLVIAALADKCVPEGEPIELLNVAFEQESKDNNKSKKRTDVCSDETKDLYDVPDRQTARKGIEVLNQQRQWRFVQVNVTKKELQARRETCIRELVCPRNTVLDDSIGCALWFAARGAGVMYNKHNDSFVNYNSTARVVLVGMGADEQLAGYSRHRSKFDKFGWQGLLEELQMEICRIALRNLGRDDRIISDHGKESRFPYLDENVVSFLNNLPIWYKSNLSLPRGVGDKYLLRLAAAQMGLKHCALVPKRAIQFGSRIAKLENTKERANDVCARLQ